MAAATRVPNATRGRTAVTNPGTEVATTNGQQVARPTVHVPLGRPLADMDQAWRMAVAFANADIVGSDLRGKPANAFLVMLYGQRLGLPPEVAISAISVVKGKPRMSGQLLLAKVREAGHRPKIVHGDGKCTVTITRGDDGDEHTEEFTLADAVTAKLCSIKDGKPYARSAKGEPLPWENYPKRMLQWRAVGACVDVICPEVRMGFAVEDEMDDPAPQQERPTLAQVAAERVDQEQVVADQAETVVAQEAVEEAEVVGPAEAEGYDEEAMRAQVVAMEAEYAEQENDTAPQDLFGRQS